MNVLDDAVVLLPSDQQQKPKLVALVKAMASELQRAADTTDDLGTQLKAPEGVWLDARGDLFGVNRADTTTDEQYTSKIKAYAAANFSNGSIAALLRVVNALHAEALAKVQPWAALTVEIQLPGSHSSVVRRLLRNALLNATQNRVLISTADAAASDQFAFALSACLPEATTPGDVTLQTQLGDLAGGTVEINPGLSDAESCVYTKTDDGGSIVFTATTAHAVGSAVVFSSVGAGYGAGQLSRTEEAIGMVAYGNAEVSLLGFAVVGESLVGMVSVTGDGTATLLGFSLTGVGAVTGAYTIDEGRVTDGVYTTADEGRVADVFWALEDEGRVTD